MDYVNDSAEWQRASQAGVAAAAQFGYRAYQAAVRDLFAHAWGVELRAPAGIDTVAPEIAGVHSSNGYVKH
jgi:hypothetical protein